jgi:urease accessory protein UreH
MATPGGGLVGGDDIQLSLDVKDDSREIAPISWTLTPAGS